MNVIEALIAITGASLFLIFSYWSAKALDVLQKLPATSHQHILEELGETAPVYGLFLVLFGTGFIAVSLVRDLEPIVVPASIILGLFGVGAMMYTLYTETMDEYAALTQHTEGQD